MAYPFESIKKRLKSVSRSIKLSKDSKKGSISLDLAPKFSKVKSFFKGFGRPPKEKNSQEPKLKLKNPKIIKNKLSNMLHKIKRKGPSPETEKIPLKPENNLKQTLEAETKLKSALEKEYDSKLTALDTKADKRLSQELSALKETLQHEHMQEMTKIKENHNEVIAQLEKKHAEKIKEMVDSSKAAALRESESASSKQLTSALKDKLSDEHALDIEQLKSNHEMKILLTEDKLHKHYKKEMQEIEEKSVRATESALKIQKDMLIEMNKKEIQGIKIEYENKIAKLNSEHEKVIEQMKKADAELQEKIKSFKKGLTSLMSNSI